MARTASEKKTCLKCGNDYAVSSFYSHRNPLLHERFGFCKKCVKGNVDLNDMETLYNFLRTMDIPYLKEFWKQANDAENETIGTYLKNLNSLKQNKELRFKDSDDITGKTNKAELLDIDTDFQLTDEIVKKWGRNLELEDYIFLEEEFENLGGYEAETTIQERLFKNMAKTQWMANKAYEEGDHGKYEKMMKTLSQQMNDANIKPVQVKSASEDGGFRSWGEIVKMIEETEPISDQQDEFKDVDGIYKYIDRWFITQLKRVFGKIKDEDIVKLDGED
ncbi:MULTISPECIES: hypothetical protein [Bacillus subtilis group]|uniref:hypothetical protein n=1 Tax=Bacillus subtilis group TaxID=653685 RepID=UPI0011A8FD35|nr:MULTISPECIES: hypothetical protein [Bacillus subtilis group]MCY8228678.1 hypothetical protein [Bacillus spizizenii]MCY9056072.1 hypothetical protein [Bacillus spizizenii]MCY9124878.1 hypothetical protein [Bacillus spizizenii]MEC2335099.1 hypothetical protein [Bacillus subtilis]